MTKRQRKRPKDKDREKALMPKPLTTSRLRLDKYRLTIFHTEWLPGMGIQILFVTAVTRGKSLRRLLGTKSLAKQHLAILDSLLGSRAQNAEASVS